jgi:uncharacterized membrane protein YccC
MRALLTNLAQDFSPAAFSRQRLADEVACLLSVLLAIALAHGLGVRNVGWAAFSAYIVFRLPLADSLVRGGLRLAGTLAGVSLAWLLAPVLLPSTALLSLALALVGVVSLYQALSGRCGYGWLLAGLSFAMVLVDGMSDASISVADFARSRFAEVGIGAGVSILVSAAAGMMMPLQASGATLADDVPGAAPLTAPRTALADALSAAPLTTPRTALWHASQGALALALIPWVYAAWQPQELSQSSITILAVMMVPATAQVDPARSVTLRVRHRLLGCVAGGALATMFLLLSHASNLGMLAAASLGVLIGRHIENGRLGLDYAGNQFALAFLVVLVADSYSPLQASSAVERLAGVLLGIALLEPVRLLFKLLLRQAHPAGQPGR